MTLSTGDARGAETATAPDQSLQAQEAQVCCMFRCRTTGVTPIDIVHILSITHAHLYTFESPHVGHSSYHALTYAIPTIHFSPISCTSHPSLPSSPRIYLTHRLPVHLRLLVCTHIHKYLYIHKQVVKFLCLSVYILLWVSPHCYALSLYYQRHRHTAEEHKYGRRTIAWAQCTVYNLHLVAML